MPDKSKEWLKGFILGSLGLSVLFVSIDTVKDISFKENAIKRGYIKLLGKDYKLVPVDVKTILIEKEK